MKVLYSVSVFPNMKVSTHPNKFKNPNISTKIPMIGHLRNIRRIPPKKHAVPLIFCLRAKK